MLSSKERRTMGSVTASGKSPQSQGFLADEIRVSKGDPAPFGATVLRTGVNFALYSRNATSVTLELFASAVEKPVHEIRLDPAEHRTGDVWHVFVEGVGPGARYGYRVDRAPNENSAVHRYDPTRLVLDPFALARTLVVDWTRTSSVSRRAGLSSTTSSTGRGTDLSGVRSVHRSSTSSTFAVSRVISPAGSSRREPTRA